MIVNRIYIIKDEVYIREKENIWGHLGSQMGTIYTKIKSK